MKSHQAGIDYEPKRYTSFGFSMSVVKFVNSGVLSGDSQ